MILLFMTALHIIFHHLLNPNVQMLVTFRNDEGIKY